VHSARFGSMINLKLFKDDLPTYIYRVITNDVGDSYQ
jgi:hypothetical protein